MDLRKHVICDKCNKPVECLEVKLVEFGPKQVFTVWCHGEADECTIDPRDINMSNVVEIRAFRQQPAISLQSSTVAS